MINLHNRRSELPVAVSHLEGRTLLKNKASSIENPVKRMKEKVLTMSLDSLDPAVPESDSLGES